MAKRSKTANRKKLEFGKKTEVKPANNKIKQVVMYPAGIHDGCTAWRFDWIRTALNYTKTAQVQMTNFIQPMLVDLPQGKSLNPMYATADAIVMQRPVQPQQVQQAEYYKKAQELIRRNNREPFRFIIDVDDVVHADHISDFNMAKAAYADNQRFNIFSEVVKRCDELHVCSKTMRDFYKETIGFDRITHRPNLMPKYLFDVFYNPEEQRRRYEKNKARPRVLWAGSWSPVDMNNVNGGKDDFTPVKEFVLKTIKEYKWVFVGAFPSWIKEHIDSGEVEYYPWMSITDFPRMMWNLEPTIMFAPLADNMFNRCKSNIKLTEAGAMGIAGVFQDLDPYEDAPLKFKTGDEMADHFKYLLSSWENYNKVATQMREYSSKYFLEDNLNMVSASYFTPFDSSARLQLSSRLQQLQ